MTPDGKFLIAAVLIAIGGCGGGSDDGASGPTPPPNEEPPPPPPPPPPDGSERLPRPILGVTCDAGADRGDAHGGLWFSADSTAGERRLLVAETGEFRWISADGWDQQIFGTFDAGFASDDAIWGWVEGLTWLETNIAAVDFQGTLDADSNLSLSYLADGSAGKPGTMSFADCNSVYTRGSSLATIEGDYLNGLEMLSIDSAGKIYYQAGTCVGKGAVELIDAQFNMYRMELEITSCSGNEVYVTDPFSGLAYLSDSGPGHTGDLLEYSLTSASEQHALFWSDIARK